MICPECRKEVRSPDGLPLFCPWCGTKLSLSGDAELNSLLTRADNERDYAKKHEILLDAAKRYSDNIEIEKRLLFIGRLWEKGGKPDFYRIPYWPLNALEKPGEFSARERAKMLSSFFDNPEVARIAALSGDERAFLSEYYHRMAADYIDLFIKNATSNNSFLFFRRSENNRLSRYAGCVKAMIANLENAEAVPQDLKPVMKQALLSGFRTVFGVDLSDVP